MAGRLDCPRSEQGSGGRERRKLLADGGGGGVVPLPPPSVCLSGPLGEGEIGLTVSRGGREGGGV